MYDETEVENEARVREERFLAGQIHRISRSLLEYERRSRETDTLFDVPSREVLESDIKDGVYRLVERRITVAEIKRDVEAYLRQQGYRYTGIMGSLVDCVIDGIFD